MPFAAPDGADLVAPLARGAVFDVALVRDHGEIAVCKRLLPRVIHEPAARAAMAREGLSLARARHPSLPALRRVGSDARGPFLIEERVAGASARALVEGWRARGQPVPPRLVAHLALAAAEALAEVHALADDRGPIAFTHGDLGPDHVIMSPLGAARFLDLGAARVAGMDEALHTGDRGTLPYAAPEVARGEVAPDQAADVYALAATLLYLAVGGPICAAHGDAAMLLDVGDRGIDPAVADRAAGLSDRGRDAILHALRLDRRDRLTRAADLAAALA